MADYLKVSAIKKFLKAKEKRCSKDFIDALDQEVASIITKSMEGSKAITVKELIK